MKQKSQEQQEAYRKYQAEYRAANKDKQKQYQAKYKREGKWLKANASPEKWEKVKANAATFRRNANIKKRTTKAAREEFDKGRRAIIDSVKLKHGCSNPQCGWTGATLPACCYDFHHKDRTTKKFCLGSSKWSQEATYAEMRKCVILCVICHRMHHAGLLDVSNFVCVDPR